MEIVKLIAAGAFVAFLALRGLSSRPGFATWHMFVHAERCHFDLQAIERDRLVPFNPWLYIPHTAIQFNWATIDFLLFYVRVFVGARVSGTIVLDSGEEPDVLMVRDSRVVG
ncbi:MAG TPA: hypothetical protein VIS95_10195 [Solirubrobacterales bacterium]